MLLVLEADWDQKLQLEAETGEQFWEWLCDSWGFSLSLLLKLVKQVGIVDWSWSFFVEYGV